MSTQISVPARNRMELKRGWLAGAILVVSLVVAGSSYVALRDDGAPSKAAPASVTAQVPQNTGALTGSDGLATQGTDAVSVPSVAQHAALARHAAQRPGWIGIEVGGGPGPGGGCVAVGRQPC
jgi:hypothetical protein